MRYEPIILALVFFVPGVSSGDISTSVPTGELYFDFDKPNGSVDAFDVEKEITFRNNENQTVVFSALSVSVTGISGITVTPGVTTLTVPAGVYEKGTLTFHADSSMAQGEYSGNLVISGTNVDSSSYPLNVEINHPPATIDATWNVIDLGSVKAGSNFTYTLTVSEVMGYKSAKDVNVSIFGFGPVENVTYAGKLGDFDPLTSKDIKVKFLIPGKGIKPGTYSIIPTISSSSTVTANTKTLNYTVPSPVMVVNPKRIDFEKITFETGKDRKRVNINISETGGYTPIEKLTFTLVSGERDWITFLEMDYLPAGESKNYSSVISLPPDASLGLKSWDFKLDTSYAGSEAITAIVIVTFPGTDEAIEYLKNASIATNSSEEKNLIRDTVSLLEASKSKTQLRKIAMVMSVYSGARTFLKNLDTASTSGDNIVGAGDAIIKAKTALNKMEIGDQNLDDAELKIYSSRIVSNALQLWESRATGVLGSLEDVSKNGKSLDYKSAASYYKIIGDIYTILDQPANAEIYSGKQNDIENLYYSSVLKASDMIGDADRGLESARGATFSPVENVYMVMNPFSYDFVSGKYDDAIDKYGQAEVLYRKAGEEKDANLIREELDEITRQKNNIYRAFIVYGSLLGLIFLWFIGRVTWGLHHYAHDEMDGRWGDVITGGEASVIGGTKTEAATKDAKGSEKGD